MITLSLTKMIFFYVLALLALIALAWVACDMVRWIRENRARRFRIHCTICGMEFEDRRGVELPRCPRCGNLNERLKVKAY